MSGGGKVMLWMAAIFFLQIELGLLFQNVVRLLGCVGDHGLEVAAQVDLYFASFAALVKIRAGLAALQWASAQGILEVCIQTDSSVFVHGLCNPQEAATSL